ncbi:phosphate acetyltransferase [Atopobacter sp. AH10]|uniref:phosphate acetyltransferase n=1 Tax=Atopobacter sp. AH10 TaxID=2315861 RepID=UPI000EF17819|nr:phosphate acetyltransferase [Atopobacter sp. AH10]RLK63886.1 phosphate acetyltransferase [Atopobacter sp. AH10]
MDLIQELKEKVVGKGISIVFPESLDSRILRAAVRLKAENICQPVLLGNEEEIRAFAKEQGVSVDGLTLIDPYHYEAYDELVEAFVERRKGKATKEQAESLLRDETYFGTMLVYLKKADGLVSGAIHSTGDTVRPALQIVKTKPGVSRTSGAFLLLKNEERFIMGDCAINIDPSAQELGEIAVETAKTAKMFGVDTKVALLSFSTKGSAKADQAQKVAEATKIAQELAPEFDFDGELQFDAAFVPAVAQLKAPGSSVAGKAKVFVFPEIQSGNIGYKIAQRLGGYEAVGPILQGLNAPISDLSRGCVEEDVYKLAIITANQTLVK